jgi:hypothetical protein
MDRAWMYDLATFDPVYIDVIPGFYAKTEYSSYA